jgi:hypothetical protein
MLRTSAAVIGARARRNVTSSWSAIGVSAGASEEEGAAKAATFLDRWG